MSISAITIRDQDCNVEIKWLHQCYVLDTKNDTFCVLEFIVEVRKGNLKDLDLYLPYKIDELKNKTPALLDENNKYFYSEGYKVISVDTKNAKCGEIIMDGLKTEIGEISLKQARTNLGSKITIDFPKIISARECRAVRIQFSCKNLEITPSADKHSITLKYYDTNDAKFLKLDKAVQVNHFFVWLVFPYGANSISNITPLFFQQRTWDNVNLKLMEIFYGSKTKVIWSKLPRTFGLWARHFEHKEPALKAWTSLYLHCDYAIQKIKLKGRTGDEEEQTEYRIWYKGSEPEGERIDSKVKEDKIENAKDYDLLIIREETRTQVFINGKKVRPVSGKLTYRVLNYVLRNKGSGGTAWNIAEHIFDVKYADDFRDIRGLVKAIKMQPDLDKAKRQTAEELFKGEAKRFSKLARRRIEDLNKFFLKKIPTELKTNEMKEFELTPLPNYCLIEKI